MKIKKSYGIFLILITSVLLLTQDLTCALRLDFRMFGYNNSFHIDTSDYPHFKIIIKAIKDGNSVQMAAQNFIFTEDNLSAPALSVSQPDINGWQTVTWITTIKYPFSKIRAIASYQDETYSADLNYYLSSVSFVKIVNEMRNMEPDMSFGNLSRGSSKVRYVIVSAGLTRYDSLGLALPVRVDSVRSNSGDFSYFWIGTNFDTKNPPVDMISPFGYYCNINFYASEDRYYHNRLTVYYDRGRKEYVNLIANQYFLDKKTVLNITQPNGGEILVPCQKYNIRWKGALDGLPVKIYLSTDKGASWNIITATTDSSYQWTVPDINTGDARIRILQDFRIDDSRTLKTDNIPVRKVGFNSTGTRLIGANDAGVLSEWDLKTDKNLTKYELSPGLQYPGVKVMPHGVDYIENDTKIVSCFYRYTAFSGRGQDTLVFFDSSVIAPAKKVALETENPIKKLVVDRKKHFIALVPETGTKIEIRSPADGSLSKVISFSYPVTAFVFNHEADECALSLMNGEVRILSLPDFSIKKILDFSHLPVIAEIGFSSDGKLLALGCTPPTPSTMVRAENQVYVADIKTGLLVRTMRTSASLPVALEFNPSSSILVVALQTLPHLTFWDLQAETFPASMILNGEMTDMKFSPEGHLVATSGTGPDNLNVKKFSYPESDVSDTTFSIIRPVLTSNPENAGREYLANSRELLLTKTICNTGTVPVALENARLFYGLHFKLKTNFVIDTLYPGDCSNIDLVYQPLDTGRLTDSIVISTCTGSYYIPIEGYGINRTITYFENPFDFGSLCLAKESEKTIIVARNDDPIPLRVNSAAIGDNTTFPFRITRNVSDTIIQPGGSFNISVKFQPLQLGVLQKKLVIYHSDQKKIFPETILQGRGIGTEIKFSHNDLRFIPEILTRTIFIFNNSPNDIKITGTVINPPGLFTVNTQMPFDIPANGQAPLSISWNGTQTTDAKLSVEAEPCVTQSNINLGLYSGKSIVSCPVVQADPKGEAVIPVSYINTEKYPYSGTRFFDAEFTINKGMFLPQTITSPFGTAAITRNDINDYLRIIGFRVEGDFPRSGTIAEIKGIAGLTDTDISLITFNNSLNPWGISVNTTYNNGAFKLINLCGDRRILSSSAVRIVSVAPNPVSEQFEIIYELGNSGNCQLEIIDELGNQKLAYSQLPGNNGINRFSADVTKLPAGTYRLIMRQGQYLATEGIIIIR